MWTLERTEVWHNLSGCGGTKSFPVSGTVDLPHRPKTAEIRKEVNRLLTEQGFVVSGPIDFSLRSAGIIMGDLQRIGDETRSLDEFHSDGFTLINYN